MGAQPIIEVEGLTKVYKPLWGPPVPALQGVHLRIEPGSAFGLIGLNGAGKTTLIKALLSVVHPSSGTVRVFGQPPSLARMRARIGYLPERLRLPGSYRPAEYLWSLGRLRALPREQLRKEIPRQIQRVGLTDRTQSRIKTFSKGMRQRLALAAALLGQPDLLVLDEPTDGVDPLGRMEFRDLIAEERGRGATLFINSHLLSETERICDRVAILHAGRVIKEGAIGSLLEAATYRVRFQPAEGLASQLAPLGFKPATEPGLLLFEAADPVALNQALDHARSQGALLLGLEKHRSELEQVLASAVAASAAPAEAS